VSEYFYQKCSCPDERQCALRSAMKELRDVIVTHLEKVTVADLCERAQHLKDASQPGWDFAI
jgi:DNA-binding IscR family transcriptional regulator